MNKKDFLSINAVHHPAIQELFRRALDGEMTKSDFVEEYCAAPKGNGRNKRKGRKAKTAVWQSDNLEKHFGWLWK